jgi:iron complex transport system permease protein
MSEHQRIRLAAIAVVSLAVLMFAPFLGIEPVGPAELLSSSGGSLASDIFWSIRVPRVFAAFIVGASLSMCGMAFQALFRNPLATPYTLGVSSGAAFGATAYLRMGALVTILGFPGRSIAAFAGAILSVGIVWVITRGRRGFSTATMLLAGVAVNFFFSSIILFIQYLSDFTDSFRIIRWLMGGLETVGWRPVAVLFPFVAFGCAVLLVLTQELNLMLLGEDIATSRGVSTGRLKTTLLIIVSLMTGSVVAVAGPIGFVGMMCPHLCRLIIGHDHRYLAPACMVFGGAFLTLCDTLARTVIAPAEMPVGVITALLGGPFFLWLLFRGGSETSITA